MLGEAGKHSQKGKEREKVVSRAGGMAKRKELLLLFVEFFVYLCICLYCKTWNMFMSYNEETTSERG